MSQAYISNDLSRVGVDHGPQAQLIISIKEVDLGLHPFARLSDGSRQIGAEMLHGLKITVDSKQGLGIVKLHRPNGQPWRLDRESNRHVHIFSARAAPLEAGVVVTLRETKGVFRSSLLRSPA